LRHSKAELANKFGQADEKGFNQCKYLVFLLHGVLFGDVDNLFQENLKLGHNWISAFVNMQINGTDGAYIRYLKENV
jgi:hypothetical protein